MADFPPPRTTTIDAGAPPTTAVLVVYLLLGLAAITQIAGGIVAPAPLLTFVGIVGVIVAYVKRDDARGSWAESHLTWLIRTFWWSTLWAVIGWVLFLTFIGIPVAWALWAIVAVWVIYRVIRGVLYFKDQRPIPGA
jgi:uncharacterized membrane protein